MLSSSNAPGAPTWIDLGSNDTDASSAFYTDLFGWTARSAGPDSGGYIFFELDGRMVGGLGPNMEPGSKGAWTPYFGTADVETTSKSVEMAGGTVRMPAMDVMTFGRMAQYTDPTGAEFAVWQPLEHSGFQVVDVPGSVSWVELQTHDGPVAIAFYEAVLGWTVTPNPIGPDMVYNVVSLPGSAPTGFAGIMADTQFPAVLWNPNFEVADCDATVARATGRGASTLMGPETMPGIGRMAQLTDPLGARFSVIATEAPAQQG
jgi:predicted enzyme related to lactoylglutathione lyase